jgi:hypothetical protein
MGLVFWLLYGTLLGAVRDNAFIPHDRDTDLGMFARDEDLFCKVVERLKVMGFELIRTKRTDGVLVLVTVMRNDEYIDFDCFASPYPGSDKYAAKRPLSPVTVDRFQFDNLITTKFYNQAFAIPAAPHPLFLKWYGPDWATPLVDKWGGLC